LAGGMYSNLEGVTMQSDLGVLPDLTRRVNSLRINYLRARGRLRRGESPEVGRELKTQLVSLERYLTVVKGKLVCKQKKAP